MHPFGMRALRHHLALLPIWVAILLPLSHLCSNSLLLHYFFHFYSLLCIYILMAKPYEKRSNNHLCLHTIYCGILRSKRFAPRHMPPSYISPYLFCCQKSCYNKRCYFSLHIIFGGLIFVCWLLS